VPAAVNLARTVFAVRRRAHFSDLTEASKLEARLSALLGFEYIEPVAMRIEHLFISPGHNFFGHHGRPAGEHPMIPVDCCECVAGQGIRGDRFFGFKDDYKGQITFFSMEVLEALRQELNLPAAQAQATRRNAFVRGADLKNLIGQDFEIQGVRLAGIEESKPCHWMNSALGPGAEEWLKGRAGLRCRILTNGILRRDD
jgi:hypothetical protein